ncbi:hypothetical protein Tco_0164328 [Tanacetum coccineum]
MLNDVQSGLQQSDEGNVPMWYVKVGVSGVFNNGKGGSIDDTGRSGGEGDLDHLQDDDGNSDGGGEDGDVADGDKRMNESDLQSEFRCEQQAKLARRSDDNGADTNRGFLPHIGVTLLIITRDLNFALDLDDLLGWFMDNLWTSELAISNLGPADRLSILSTIKYLERCNLNADLVSLKELVYKATVLKGLGARDDIQSRLASTTTPITLSY